MEEAELRRQFNKIINHAILQSIVTPPRSPVDVDTEAENALLDLYRKNERVAQEQGVAWAIMEIDDMHMNSSDDGSYKLDGIFKGIKNSLRDRFKLYTGVDPAPNYPIKVTLSNTHKTGDEDAQE